MKNETIAVPVKPEPLSIYVLHSPSEIRAHKALCADYNDAIRQIEHQELVKKQAAFTHANRTLTDDEYYQANVERENNRKAIQAERDATIKAEEFERIAYLLSFPEQADLLHRSELNFINDIIHWAKKGYELSPAGVLACGNGLFHLQMVAPQAVKKASK